MTRRRIAIVLISSFLITGILVAIISFASTNASCVLHLVEGRQYNQPPAVKQPSLSIEPVWSITVDTPARGLAQADDWLFVLDSRCNEIASFDQVTGEIRWTSVFGSPVNVVINGTKTVVYVYGGWGWIQALNAYDIETGNEIWGNTSRNFQRGSLIPYMLPDNEMYVYLSPQGDYLPVDPQSGQFGDPVDVSHLSYLIEDGLLWQATDSKLWARVPETENVVWTSTYEGLPDCCLKQIYRTDNIIITRFSSGLMGLESQSGNLVWMINDDNFASNFSVDENHVYILDREGNLRLLDLLTGNEIQRVQFIMSSENDSPSTDGRFAIESWLSSITDGYISIYFQQSRELSTYRIIGRGISRSSANTRISIPKVGLSQPRWYTNKQCSPRSQS